MKNFATAQQNFLSNLEGSDEEEDEDSELGGLVSYGTCIVCQEDLNENRPFGSLALIQPSRFIRHMPVTSADALARVLKSSPSLQAGETIDMGEDALYPVAAIADKTNFGMHASVCGHMMHFECFGIYGASVRQRHRSQAQRNHPESIPRKEYICPLCKSLGNAVLPICKSAPISHTSQTFVEWVRGKRN